MTHFAYQQVFMDKVTAEIESCYGLVIGTITGSTDLVLINMNEFTMEATALVSLIYSVTILGN